MNSLDDARLRQLIEEEIAHYLAEVSARRIAPPASKNLPTEARLHEQGHAAPIILVLLDGVFSPPEGHGAPLGEVFTQMQALSRFHRLVGVAAEEFCAVYSPLSLRERCGIELVPAEGHTAPNATAQGEVLSVLARAQAVIAPVLAQDTIVTLALGLADSLGAWILLRALLMGKKVIAVADFALAELQRGSGGIVKPAPSSLANLMYQYLERLRQWGVTFIAPRDIFQSVEGALASVGEKCVKHAPPPPPLKRQIVTVEDLQHAKHYGRTEVRLQRNAIITDEARDYAAREGIVLVHE